MWMVFSVYVHWTTSIHESLNTHFKIDQLVGRLRVTCNWLPIQPGIRHRNGSRLMALKSRFRRSFLNTKHITRVVNNTQRCAREMERGIIKWTSLGRIDQTERKRWLPRERLCIRRAHVGELMSDSRSWQQRINPENTFLPSALYAWHWDDDVTAYTERKREIPDLPT